MVLQGQVRVWRLLGRQPGRREPHRLVQHPVLQPCVRPAPHLLSPTEPAHRGLLRVHDLRRPAHHLVERVAEHGRVPALRERRRAEQDRHRQARDRRGREQRLDEHLDARELPAAGQGARLVWRACPHSHYASGCVLTLRYLGRDGVAVPERGRGVDCRCARELVARGRHHAAAHTDHHHHHVRPDDDAAPDGWMLRPRGVELWDCVHWRTVGHVRRTQVDGEVVDTGTACLVYSTWIVLIRHCRLIRPVDLRASGLTTALADGQASRMDCVFLLSIFFGFWDHSPSHTLIAQTDTVLLFGYISIYDAEMKALHGGNVDESATSAAAASKAHDESRDYRNRVASGERLLR